ncbi:YceI family protein [Pleomorphomonas sp. JP5]|uniref:YceI family protein n=1 Tax=Pleomorphomonas sp. JP5 TaxID=2942998 RepID=UPI0020433104|nr:YceI family protein [Pleomorphomonas sp. JP5]MCM5559282.1 YceI family protein [Pleomorphomonas sp. JP5]
MRHVLPDHIPIRLLRHLTILVLPLLLGIAPADAASFSNLAGRYAIGDQSSVTFSISGTLVPTVHGSFHRFSGSFNLDPAHVERSSVTFSVASDSVATGVAPLDSLLRSSVVFDAADNPDIHFASTAVRRTSETTADVDGLLTLKGQTLAEHFTVTLTGSSDKRPEFHVVGRVARSPSG